ncbi:MAG: efflux RND transporter periplasmic adaptor subunit [Bryobacteraceae bacterium]|jgi:cobalt-zinc-cadmium efflux system membrane fusion protein
MQNLRLLLPALAFLLAAACSRAPAPVAEAQSAQAQAADPNSIVLDDALRQRIRTGTPEWKEVASDLVVSGRVEVDATRTSRIGSPVLGRITQVLVEEGEEVKEGQRLALLHSTGLNEAQLEFLKALSQKMVAERAVARARTLLQADVIGAAELQRREAELAQATAELEAARDELALLGMPAEAIQELERTRALKSVTWIVSNRDGTVIHRRAAVGQVVQPADTIFEIADLRQVWVVADVPEKEIGQVSVGMPLTVEFDALPGRRISGRVSFVSPLVNPETRTVMVRVELANPQKLFKPAMLATMTLHGHARPMLTLPEEAFVREGDQEFVFLRADGDRFLLTPVKSIPAGDGSRAVLEPDITGREAVVAGAFHLNNERRRRNIRGSE